MDKFGLKLFMTSEGSQYLPDPKQNLSVVMHVDFLHAAQQSHDMGGILEHSQAIAALCPVSETLLFEVYPMLRKSGFDAEAQGLFDANFNHLKERLAITGIEPDALVRLGASRQPATSAWMRRKRTHGRRWRWSRIMLPCWLCLPTWNFVWAISTRQLSPKPRPLSFVPKTRHTRPFSNDIARHRSAPPCMMFQRRHLRATSLGRREGAIAAGQSEMFTLHSFPGSDYHSIMRLSFFLAALWIACATGGFVGSTPAIRR